MLAIGNTKAIHVTNIAMPCVPTHKYRHTGTNVYVYYVAAMITDTHHNGS